MSEIALRAPQTLNRDEVEVIAKTSFVPQHYRGKLPEIFACIKIGRTLGLDDMQALNSIYVVDGKVTLSGEVMIALVRAAGHSITGSSSMTEATVTGRRADNGDQLTVTFTMEEAKAAGLDKKPTYQKHAADMLFWRASSRLCRRLFPDVLKGISHVPEEVELTPDERNSVSTEDLPLPPDPEDSSAPPPPEPADDGGPSPAAAAAPDVVEQDDGALALRVPEDVRASLAKERGE